MFDKIKRYFCNILIFMMVISMGTSVVKAADEPLRINFSRLSFETFDYNPNEVYVEQYVKEGKEIAEIIDIETKEKLETMEVEKLDSDLRVVDGPYVFSRDKDLDQATVRLSVHADIYSSGSFFSINAINGSQLPIRKVVQLVPNIL